MNVDRAQEQSGQRRVTEAEWSGALLPVALGAVVAHLGTGTAWTVVSAVLLVLGTLLVLVAATRAVRHGTSSVGLGVLVGVLTVAGWVRLLV